MAKNWQLHRRTFLRGLGTMVALPVLDAMLPSIGKMSASAAGAAVNSTTGMPLRMAFVYVPQGKNMVDWTPSAEGTDYDMTPILQPLAAYRKDFNVLTGLAHAHGLSENDGGGDHARAAGV
jgi:hypothetical protein